MNAKPEHSAAVHKAHADFFFKFGKWWKARKNIIRKQSSNQLKGIYPGAVFFEHFVLKKQTFSELSAKDKLVS
jgi:hypothetical protein